MKIANLYLIFLIALLSMVLPTSMAYAGNLNSQNLPSISQIKENTNSQLEALVIATTAGEIVCGYSNTINKLVNWKNMSSSFGACAQIGVEGEKGMQVLTTNYSKAIYNPYNNTLSFISPDAHSVDSYNINNIQISNRYHTFYTLNLVNKVTYNSESDSLLDGVFLQQSVNGVNQTYVAFAVGDRVKLCQTSSGIIEQNAKCIYSPRVTNGYANTVTQIGDANLFVAGGVPGKGNYGVIYQIGISSNGGNLHIQSPVVYVTYRGATSPINKISNANQVINGNQNNGLFITFSNAIASINSASSYSYVGYGLNDMATDGYGNLVVVNPGRGILGSSVSGGNVSSLANINQSDTGSYPAVLPLSGNSEVTYPFENGTNSVALIPAQAFQ